MAYPIARTSFCGRSRQQVGKYRSPAAESNGTIRQTAFERAEILAGDTFNPRAPGS